jgi:hypothetical protein
MTANDKWTFVSVEDPARTHRFTVTVDTDGRGGSGDQPKER